MAKKRTTLTQLLAQPRAEERKLEKKDKAAEEHDNLHTATDPDAINALIRGDDMKNKKIIFDWKFKNFKWVFKR